jgi:hypothetical protein
MGTLVRNRFHIIIIMVIIIIICVSLFVFNLI